MIRVVVAPAGLPRFSRFAVIGQDAQSQLLERVVGFFQPHAERCGCVASVAQAPADADVALLTCLADWETVLAPCDHARSYYIPAVESRGWSWWTFAAQILDKLIPGAPAGLPWEQMFAFLKNWTPPPLIPHQGKIAINPRVYFPFTQGLSKRFPTEIAAVTARLDDADSKRHYQAVCHGEPSGLWKLYVESVFNSVQYFDYLAMRPGDVVLSLGVDDGFETPGLQALIGPHGRIHQIDPFADDQLDGYVRQAIATQPQVNIFHRLAMSDAEGEVEMAVSTYSGMAFGGTIGADLSHAPKTVRCPAATIDSFVAAQGLTRVDLIKSDTEGAELRVIAGMAETVRRFRPQLAFSIYHSVEEFWKVPQALIALCPDYQFYVRHYSFKCWDTIFYAIPKERAGEIVPPPTPPLAVLVAPPRTAA